MTALKKMREGTIPVHSPATQPELKERVLVKSVQGARCQVNAV